MRSKAATALVVTLAAPMIGAPSPSKLDAPAAKSFTASLTGQAEVALAQEIGTGGDMDGSGQVRLAVNPESRKICYNFELSHVATPLMAHIHRGHALSNGPSVVTLFTGPGGELTNCVMWTEKWLSQIVASPSDFYVNLYTTEYPDGALRGQLLE